MIDQDAVERLIEDLQRGGSSGESFRRLFDLYRTPIFRFFAKRGFSPEECEDLTQETFIGIYKGISSYRGQARFESWILTIATNAFRKELRRRSARKRSGSEVSLDAGQEDPSAPDRAATIPSPRLDPAGEVVSRERAWVLREAVEGLPGQMRRCLILRVVAGLTYRQIGETLRISTETVKAHLGQARKRVKKALAERYENGGRA